MHTQMNTQHSHQNWQKYLVLVKNNDLGTAHIVHVAAILQNNFCFGRNSDLTLCICCTELFNVNINGQTENKCLTYIISLVAKILPDDQCSFSFWLQVSVFRNFLFLVKFLVLPGTVLNQQNY